MTVNEESAQEIIDSVQSLDPKKMSFYHHKMKGDPRDVTDWAKKVTHNFENQEKDLNNS